MNEDNGGRPAEDGFELGGTFYRWRLTDQGKDLMLIDRFTAMPITEFFELVEDGVDVTRTPVLLAMIATSIRAGHPSWSVERITRLVMDTSLSDVTFVEGEAREDSRPPTPAAAGPAATSELSTSPPADSSSSPIPTVSSSSPTSSGGPA